MSLRTSLRVWTHSQTRGAARCLMLAIADLANDDGVAWPGTAMLAERINETPDYTDTLIKKCIDAGELFKMSGRGRGHKTRFAILCGLDVNAVKAIKGALQKGYSSTPLHEKDKRGTTKGVLESAKRGTFTNAKQQPNGATGPGETAQAKNDIHHDPNHGGGDGDRARAKKTLQDSGMYPATVKQILALPIDPPTLIASVAALVAAGWGPGAIADQLRDNPPTKGQPYERPANGQPNGRHSAPPNQRRRSAAIPQSNPERDAEYAALIAKYEREAAERGRG